MNKLKDIEKRLKEARESKWRVNFKEAYSVYTASIFAICSTLLSASDSAYYLAAYSLRSASNSVIERKKQVKMIKGILNE